MRSEFDGWYEKWTGSKVKCENTDIIGAWQHQQSKVDELQKRVDDLTELNRLKTIALQQSVNRTSHYVHEKIVALEQALKGDQ